MVQRYSTKVRYNGPIKAPSAIVINDDAGHLVKLIDYEILEQRLHELERTLSFSFIKQLFDGKQHRGWKLLPVAATGDMAYQASDVTEQARVAWGIMARAAPSFNDAKGK